MITINKEVKEQRIQKYITGAIAKAKQVAAQGIDWFIYDIEVGDSSELHSIDHTLGEEGIKVAYKGCVFNGYRGDFKSFSVKYIIT